MQPAPSPVFYEPPLAAKPQLREKPHQGLPSKNPTWNQGPNVCNFTVTLGLRATVVENGVRETYSARYYNPTTGRFLSRDPEDPNMERPKNPKTLHKYLYAGGDPVNAKDPTGRGIVSYAIELGESLKTVTALRLTAYAVCVEITTTSLFIEDSPPPDWPAIVMAWCGPALAW
jgi:RHS repeat-associated protein